MHDDKAKTEPHSLPFTLKWSYNNIIILVTISCDLEFSQILKKQRSWKFFQRGSKNSNQLIFQLDFQPNYTSNINTKILGCVNTKTLG